MDAAGLIDLSLASLDLSAAALAILFRGGMSRLKGHHGVDVQQFDTPWWESRAVLAWVWVSQGCLRGDEDRSGYCCLGSNKKGSRRHP